MSYPLLFEPVTKDYVWGGRNFEGLGRTIPPDQIIAEFWEISAHKDGDCMISNGFHAGKKLSELRAEMGTDLIGTRSQWAQDREKFPLLIKLLDANRALSVQVHPKDDYALEVAHAW